MYRSGPKTSRSTLGINKKVFANPSNLKYRMESLELFIYLMIKIVKTFHFFSQKVNSSISDVKFQEEVTSLPSVSKEIK
jgi:hypothetical protein